MQTNNEDTFNVMMLTVGITFVVVVISVIVLQALTGNLYLNSYFVLESLFDVQNTAASTELAAIAFTLDPSELFPILIVVIADNLSRILIVSFIIAAVIDFLNYANVEGLINDLKSRALKNHIILCGYNNIAERLIDSLKKQRTSYIVIEPSKECTLVLNEKKLLNINGDFTREEVLKKAGVARAAAIIFTSESNIDNVVGSIVARKINPRIKIMSRVGDEGVRKKAYKIGTDMAVIPEHLAGIEIGEYIARTTGV